MSEALRLVRAWRGRARETGARAHSPHSGFRVGAVVVDGQGRGHVGCNVESDSYGLTQCAERSALAAAIAAGAGKGELSALLLHVPGARPLPPCGACRQLMVELLAPDALIVSCCDGEALLEWRRETILPDPFLME
jgi:cytidine deaminase